MERKKVFSLCVIMFLCVFGFKMNVYAAQELTCVYKKDKLHAKVILVQDKDGTISIFKNKKDANFKGIYSGNKVSYWTNNTDQGYSLGGTYDTNMSKIKDKNGFLTECPKGKTTTNSVKGAKDYGYVTFYSYKTGQKLIESSQSVKIPKMSKNDSTNSKISELTCIYKYSTSSKTKFAFTQSSTGSLSFYSNNSDVSYDDKNSYWTPVDADSEDKSNLKTNGYFSKCPSYSIFSSASALTKANVKFYSSNQEGSQPLEKEEKSVKQFQVSKNATAKDSLQYDASANSGKTCDQIDDSTKWLSSRNGYTLSCLYEADVVAAGGCHLIQINVGTKGVDVFDSESSRFVSSPELYSLNKVAITEAGINSINGGDCPTQLQVKRVQDDVIGSVKTTISFSGNYSTYLLVGADGKNMVTGATANAEFNFGIKFNKISIASCEDLFKDNDDLLSILKTLVTIVKILVPIILIVLGVLDFAQAVFAQSEDNIKKSQQKFIKRLVIALGIFLIPSVLKVILSIAHSIWPIIDASLCGII